jgi:hypothetical protein
MVRFDSHLFERSHGKQPRGEGMWCFAPEGDDRAGRTDRRFWFNGTFAEAKKAAKAHYTQLNVRKMLVGASVQYVEVLP